MIDGFDAANVGEAFFAGRLRGAVVQDAVGEVIDLADELHGVFFLAGFVDGDGRSSLFGSVAAVKMLSLIGECADLQPSVGAVDAVEAAHVGTVG